MDTLKKFTTRSLKLNKKRTMVTIIGIILSVALICAVAGIFESLRESLIQNSINDNGKYHTMFQNASTQSVDIVKNNKTIDSFYYTQELGYAKFDSRSPYTTHLYLLGYNDKALTNAGLKLESGRMPEKDDEILITQKFNINSVNQYEIGQVLELDISEDDESSEVFTKEYKIVGIVENINYLSNSPSQKAITAITYLEKQTSNINLYVYYNNPKDVESEDAILATSFGVEKDNINNNRELLRWQGVMGEETLETIYIIAAIVIGIIIFTSVFVIKNGFAISILERNKEYGILASIGATRKQIKKNVLFEGFVLGIISIPIGIILGVGAVYILITIMNELLVLGINTRLVYIVPYVAIAISVILGTLTIYLSCYFIARKTAKISPIDSIRSSEDIKLNSKKIKVPKIIRKIFKTGGVIAYKNIQRNKRKYRTTVISMIISVVLFLSMTSFTNYAFKATTYQFQNTEYNIQIRGNPEVGKFYEQTDKIVKLLGDDKYSIVKYAGIPVNNKYINFDFAQHLYYTKSEEQENYIAIYAIGDSTYKDYVKKLDGDYNYYKDKGILIDEHKIKVSDKWEIGSIFDIKDSIELRGRKETIDLKIAKKTDIVPMPLSDMQDQSYIIVSDETIEKLGYETEGQYMAVNSSDPYALEEEIIKLNEGLMVSNYDEYMKDAENLMLIENIFLYGFLTVITIIGLTNIINTLTASINLRKKEFAMLKAIGTTGKEFKQMINLESIFLGLKVLIIGIPIGVAISYFMYNTLLNLNSAAIIKYEFDFFAIIASIIAVFLIVKIIMSYSIKRINKQNMIDTIRDDNI